MEKTVRVKVKVRDRVERKLTKVKGKKKQRKIDNSGSVVGDLFFDGLELFLEALLAIFDN